MKGCQRCDRCCREENIEVTPDEFRTMLEAAPARPEGMRLVDLFDHHLIICAPCPFYQGACTIYDSRPAMCRGFLCNTDNPGDKDRARFYDPDYLKAWEPYKRDGYAWGAAHGWKIRTEEQSTSDDAPRG